MTLAKQPLPSKERNSHLQGRNGATSIMADVRPEVAAGGILRDDGEIDFHVRVNALLQPETTVLDYGAGRGAVFFSDKIQLREKLAKLQGKVRKVIGVDVDNGIFEHPFLDERHLIGVNAPIPVADQSIDLIVSHWVFEHVENPSLLSAEFYRILKPGGWICARTPHRWSYVGIATCLLPESMQRVLLRWIKPGFEAGDKFPTVYRLNSFRALRENFPGSKWFDCSYGVNSAPRYHFQNRWIFKMLSAYQAVAWPKTDLMVLIQKKAD